MSDTILRLHGLTKIYGSKTAVQNVSFTIQKGRIYGFIGENGAGKTTTIRMLTCLSAATEGSCAVCGADCAAQPEKVKSVIGISPQDTAVAENLTVRENLQFMAQVCGCDAGETARRTEEMLSLFRMEEVAGSRAKTLSGGWKRKLSIAMAMIGQPKVLFLDEPTLGLDVLARRELWKVIRALKGRITILLTTHYMEEAEQLADRIAVMIGGRITACGTLTELETLTGKAGLEEAFVAIAEGSVEEHA